MKYSKTVVEKEINGTQYSANKLGARDISREGINILKTIAPSFATGVSAIMGMPSEDGEVSMPDLTDIIYILSEKLEEETFVRIQEEVMGSLKVDGKQLPDWSDYFDQHIEDYWDVLGWLLKENFYDFFIQNSTVQRLVEWFKSIAMHLQSGMPSFTTTEENGQK